MDFQPLNPATLDSDQSSPEYNMRSKNKSEQSLQKEFEEYLQATSESELRSHRLDVFNEKLCTLIQDQLSNKYKNEEELKRWQSNVIQDQSYIAPHIKVGPGVIRPTCITVGDPFRCEVVAKMCEKYEEIQWNREYRLYNATFEDSDISIISHGIGGPGAAICFEELIKLGAKTIIRLGTCGAM